jgi:hypothetical protein
MKTFDPKVVSGEQFASMLEIAVSGNTAAVKFPNGTKAKGSKKAWTEDQYTASQTLFDAAGGYFQLIACARQKIVAAISEKSNETKLSINNTIMHGMEVFDDR